MLDKFVTLPEALPEIDSTERRVIRDHRTFLLEHPKTTHHVISVVKGVEEQHNWYRYFMVNRIPQTLFYPIMLLNNINSLLDFDPSIATILIPDASVVNDIIVRAQS